MKKEVQKKIKGKRKCSSDRSFLPDLMGQITRACGGSLICLMSHVRMKEATYIRTILCLLDI